jgi:outer membrane cobalamin receptor
MLPLIAAAFCCAVTGFVHTLAGAPIAHARLAVDTRGVAGESDAAGRFTLRIDPGPHALNVSADGFGATTIDRVVIHEGTSFDVLLEPLAANSLRTIGRVVVDGRLALVRGASPSETISRASMDDLGYQHVTDALQEVPSVTLPRPDAGAPGAVAVVALRGPDPSETLVALDGQILNNTNTGDLDLSQFPVSPFRAIDVTEGLGPETATGANTIGGEVNFRSLEPTLAPHSLFTASYGSFGTTTLAANTTGRVGKLGYALAGGDVDSEGLVHAQTVSYANPGGTNSPLGLDSGTRTQTLLANLTYSFSQEADVRVRYFTIADARDVSAALNAPLPDGTFTGPGPAAMTQGIRALLLSARAPLGGGSLSASYAASGTTSTYDGGASASPYDVSNIDRLGTFSFGWERSNANVDLALGGYTRSETLAIPGVFDSTQREHSQAAYARAAWNAGPKVRVFASGYDTRYSTFGSSLDGRLGAIVDLDGRSNLRFSAGTGFRAPLLTELYQTPLSEIVAGLPGSVDAHCVALNGNPNEKPEHVTTYEAAYGRQVDSDTTFDVSLYHTNLRDPIENSYPYPIPPAPPNGCTAVAGQEIPINVGNAVYEGGALRVGHRFGHFFATAEYGVNSAYPLQLPVTVSNPTSGGNLVAGSQFQGIPVDVASLGLKYAESGYHADFALTYRGINNELNARPYAVLNGALGKRAGAVDFTLAAQNITSAASGRFTQLGQGVPYATPFGAFPTDLFVLAPVTVNFIVTVRN